MGHVLDLLAARDRLHRLVQVFDVTDATHVRLYIMLFSRGFLQHTWDKTEVKRLHSQFLNLLVEGSALPSHFKARGCTETRSFHINAAELKYLVCNCI